MGETFEAGIVLFGPGVKFLRIGVRRWAIPSFEPTDMANYFYMTQILQSIAFVN
jgi:hypothetical protein